MFDGVHAGHRYLLDGLRREGLRRGLEPLALTFSNHPLEVVRPQAAPRLLTSPGEKVELIRALGIARVECIPFDEALRLTPAGDFLDMLRRRYGVEALLMGFNNRFGHDAPRDFNRYRALGAAAREITLQPDIHQIFSQLHSYDSLSHTHNLCVIAFARSLC